MKTRTKRMILASTISVIGIGGLTQAISANQSPIPVAIVHQHDHNNKIALKNDTDTEVKDDQVPKSLSEVGELGEDLYDMAKAKNWTKASTSLIKLETEAKRLATDLQGKNPKKLKQLNDNIALLKNARSP